MSQRYVLFTICIGLFLSCGPSSNESTNGALEGMRFQMDQRSYPYEIPPADAYYKAYNKIEEDFRGNLLRRGVPEWKTLGPLNTAGRALSLAVNPFNDLQLYVGTASGGLWRSDDLGRDTSWYRIETGYPVTSVSTVAISPDDSLIVMIGTGEVYNYLQSGTGAAYRSTRGAPGIGILRSSDAGKTWEMSLDWRADQNQGVNRISFSNTNPDKVAAATTSGVFLSLDNGASWTKSLDVLMATDVAFHPQNEDRIVAACGNFDSPGKGIYLSIDGGVTWEHTLDGSDIDFMGKVRLDFSNSDGDVVYASIGDAFNSNNTEFTWLIRSTDGGVNWNIRSDFDYARYQGWFAHDLAVHPTDPDKIFTVGIYPFMSSDGGRNYSQITSDQQVSQGRPPVGGPDGPSDYMHVDFHEVIFHPNDPSILLFANDGGVFISEDGGQTFGSRNGGLQTTQFYSGLSVAEYDTNLVFGGLQDNNSVLYDGEPAWVRTLGGDGAWSTFHPLDGSLIGSLQFMTTFISEDERMRWERVLTRRYSESACFVSPIIRSESNPDIVYAASAKLYRSLDGGRNWDVTGNARDIHAGDPALSMAVSPEDPNMIYCGLAPLSGESSVWLTRNGGSNWTRVGEGQLPDRYPTDVIFHPEDDGIAYVVFSGYEAGHVFRTLDNGVSWEDVTDNLPDLPVNTIAIDPLYPEIIYVGNDISVFYSLQGGGEWQILDDGLPEAMWVMDLQIHEEHRLLYCATHGNGVYKAPLLEPTLTSDQVPSTKGIELLVAPNPVTGSTLNFKLSGVRSISNVAIIDVNSRLRHETSIDMASKASLTIPDGLSSGVYYLQIESDQGRHIAPFLYLSQTH